MFSARLPTLAIYISNSIHVYIIKIDILIVYNETNLTRSNLINIFSVKITKHSQRRACG